MSITIDIPPDLEAALAAEAARLNLPVVEYARRILASRVAVAPSPTTGAELVDYWTREGVIGARPDVVDTAAHARQIRAKAERRQTP